MFDCMVKLPDVPRPVVGQEQFQRGGVDVADVLQQLFAQALDEVAGQEVDVLLTFPQGGQVDVDSAQPVKQVLTGGGFLDRPLGQGV